MKNWILIGLLLFSAELLAFQEPDSLSKDSIIGQALKPKVNHAEPLFIDLIRDLGARKGEKEWNLGMGITDNMKHDEYLTLVEYEWAPIDRLGLEIELPFTFHYPTNGEKSAPGSKLNSLKLAAQYTFLVSEKHRTSMAIGYLHEFEFPEFRNYGNENFLTGLVYNPFFVAAKQLPNNWHSLVYAGPVITQHLNDGKFQTIWQINTNFHYMIPRTRNFVGVEFNKEFHEDDFDMIIRPQMRVSITHNLLIGIVTGIPVSRENERFSSFLRLIYEP